MLKVEVSQSRELQLLYPFFYLPPSGKHERHWVTLATRNYLAMEFSLHNLSTARRWILTIRDKTCGRCTPAYSCNLLFHLENKELLHVAFICQSDRHVQFQRELNGSLCLRSGCVPHCIKAMQLKTSGM